jgi:hypothetical protein
MAEKRKRMGEALKVLMETTLGLKTANRKTGSVFNRLKYRDSRLLQRTSILVKTPFIRTRKSGQDS